MVDMINTLVAADKAYVTDDGVYLSIASVPDYGLLAHQSLDDMLSGGGDREVFGASNKRHPSDFACGNSQNQASRHGLHHGATVGLAGTVNV